MDKQADIEINEIEWIQTDVNWVWEQYVFIVNISRKRSQHSQSVAYYCSSYQWSRMIKTIANTNRR